MRILAACFQRSRITGDLKYGGRFRGRPTAEAVAAISFSLFTFLASMAMRKCADVTEKESCDGGKSYAWGEYSYSAGRLNGP